MKQRFSKRTRLVSALLTLAMVFTFLPFSAFAEGEGIPINETNFPDSNFRAYVKDKIDTDKNDSLSDSERNAVTKIDVHAMSIKRLKGIEFFLNLETLDCYSNQLTELDVSKNTKLAYLSCTSNWQLSELDVSQNIALKHLWCGSSNLSSLYLGANKELEALDCSHSQLSYLNTSNNPNLWYLDCSYNNLEKLSVNSNKLLRELSCKNNKLTKLDLQSNPNLKKVNASNNALTTLYLNNTSTQLTAGNVNVDGNAVPIKVGAITRTFYLKDLPVGYDSGRTSNWQNGKLNGDVLKVDPDAKKVLYDFDCGNGITKTFALNVTWTNEGTPSDGIALNAENFPDPEFRAYVEAKIDKDNNNSLSDSERNNVKQIDVHGGYNGQKITNLKGIEFFHNLEILRCYDNQLTKLDVSENKKLTLLSCSENQLSSLDVSQNPALQLLYCYENQLSSLDVSQNPALELLNCYGNNLTSLDVSRNPALERLSCYDNQLTSLDVSKNTALVYLVASGNQIDINVEETPRTFDLSKLPRFEASKVSKWVGGDVDGNTLKVNENVTQVTYTYDCGKGLSETFTLNVNVVPDGSTGGGTTIPPEAGKYQLTVTDGVATVNGITSDVLNVKPGDTVTLTADTTKFPENEEFGWWEITSYGSVSNTLTGQYQRTATFKMPNENVSARAMSKSAGVSTGGDDGGGGGAAILLVGGAAVAGLVGYGVYSYVSEQQLKALLPEGVAMPENRAQTALLLWNTAGRPEPAEAPAFKDVADPDTAKAAQWCVEHGLMDQKLGGRFAPDNSDPAYKTLNAYQQLVG